MTECIGFTNDVTRIDNFGVIGIKVAGIETHPNILIWGIDGIHRLYNLRTVEIPIQPTDGDTMFKFVETFW